MKLPSLPNTVAAPLAAFALSANLLLVPIGPATTPAALAADGEVRDSHKHAVTQPLLFPLHSGILLLPSLTSVYVLSHVCICFLRSP